MFPLPQVDITMMYKAVTQQRVVTVVSLIIWLYDFFFLTGTIPKDDGVMGQSVKW